MTISEQGFSTELRGYKRSEVDDVLSDLRSELIRATKDRSDILDELSALRQQVAEIESSAEQSAMPTFAGLGTRLESILRIAEEQSTKLIGQADIDSERMITLARTEASVMIKNAEHEAERTSLDAENRAANTLDGANSRADQIIEEAKAEAKALTQIAVEEAAVIRGAVVTETSKLKTNAKRETAALKSEARRELAELKFVAEKELATARTQARELAREVEAEKASHEINLKKIQEEAALAKTQREQELAESAAELKFDISKQSETLAQAADQARSDLEVELSARRAEAENELLEEHQKAVELNEYFLRETEKQLAETKSRLSTIRKEHQKIIEAIDEANQNGKVQAQNEAARAIAKAEKRAAEIVRAAEKEATDRVAAAEARLAELRSERDTIGGYVESLRSLVGPILDVAAPEQKKSAGRRTKVRDSSVVSPRTSSSGRRAKEAAETNISSRAKSEPKKMISPTAPSKAAETGKSRQLRPTVSRGVPAKSNTMSKDSKNTPPEKKVLASKKNTTRAKPRAMGKQPDSAAS